MDYYQENSIIDNKPKLTTMESNKQILDVLIWPDPKLKLVAKPIPIEGIQYRKEFIEQMFSTMFYYNGAGLAATQVGIPERIIVVREKDRPAFVLINPELNFPDSNRTSLMTEGCLSFPGVQTEVERSTQVEVSYRTMQGIEKKETFAGTLSRIIQHEVDHLDGKTFIKYISPVRRDIICRKLQKRYNLLLKAKQRSETM